MNKYKHLIVDGSNLFHRCFYLGGLEHSATLKHNLGYHVIEYCSELVKGLASNWTTEDSIIYFLFDNSQSQINLRKEIDPNYKSNRDKILADKDLYKYHNFFIEMLKVSSDNYRILMAGSLEADDLVKPLIENLSVDLTNQVLLVSNDLDWSRMLSNNIHWFNWDMVYTVDGFFSKFNFFPSQEGIKLYKAIKGDPSDHIPVGCAYVPKSEVELICNEAYGFKSWDDFVLYLQQPNKLETKTVNNLKQNLKSIRKNYSLIDFVPIDISIESYIKNCSFQPIQYRMFFQSVGLPIPDYLKSKQELTDDFFD